MISPGNIVVEDASFLRFHRRIPHLRREIVHLIVWHGVKNCSYAHRSHDELISQNVDSNQNYRSTGYILCYVSGHCIASLHSCVSFVSYCRQIWSLLGHSCHPLELLHALHCFLACTCNHLGSYADDLRHWHSQSDFLDIALILWCLFISALIGLISYISVDFLQLDWSSLGGKTILACLIGGFRTHDDWYSDQPTYHMNKMMVK